MCKVGSCVLLAICTYLTVSTCVTEEERTFDGVDIIVRRQQAIQSSETHLDSLSECGTRVSSVWVCVYVILSVCLFRSGQQSVVSLAYNV